MDFDKIKKMYMDGSSVPSIAKEVGYSQWGIYNIMKRRNFPRRKQSESNYINFVNKPLSYSIKNNLSLNEIRLRNAGLMVYWAEGSKKGKNTVDLANSDPIMIELFLKLLRIIYQVTESRLRILLYCYSNQPIDNLIEYWVGITGISREQFSKPYIRNDFIQKQNGKMPYGLVHIRYSDTKLLAQIKNDIETLTKSMLG